MTLQEEIVELKKSYLNVSNSLRMADFENYQNNTSNGCYDDRKVRNLLSDLYNAIADVENYVNVKELR
jgi:hypothetical protein